MSAHDWIVQAAAWSFPVLVLFGLIALWRFDRDPSSRFRLVQLVSNHDGTANSGSLAYVTALLVSTWTVWHEAMSGRLSEWLVLAYIGTFVAGGVIRQGIGASERVGIAKAHRPQGDMQPMTIKTTTQADTSVSQE